MRLNERVRTAEPTRNLPRPQVHEPGPRLPRAGVSLVDTQAGPTAVASLRGFKLIPATSNSAGKCQRVPARRGLPVPIMMIPATLRLGAVLNLGDQGGNLIPPSLILIPDDSVPDIPEVPWVPSGPGARLPDIRDPSGVHTG
jgi:hypothetical protein